RFGTFSPHLTDIRVSEIFFDVLRQKSMNFVFFVRIRAKNPQRSVTGAEPFLALPLGLRLSQIYGRKRRRRYRAALVIYPVSAKSHRKRVLFACCRRSRYKRSAAGAFAEKLGAVAAYKRRSAAEFARKLFKR